MFPTAHGVVSQGGTGGDQPGEAANFIESLPSLSTSSSRVAGWEFTPNKPLALIGLRVSEGFSGATTLTLWDAATEAALASVEVTAVANEWVPGLFSTPVALEKDKAYIISTSSPAQGTHRLGLAANAIFNPAITFVTGRYRGNAGFPSLLWAGRIYGVVDGILAP